MHKITTITAKIFHNSNQDELFTRSAAFAFYAVFSIPAALIIVLWVIGFYFGDQLAQDYLTGFLANFLSQDGIEVIKQILPDILKIAPLKSSSILGIILLIISTSALFSHLIKNLNKILHGQKSKKSHLPAFLLRRLLSFLIIIAIIALLFSTLIANTLLAFLQNYLTGVIPYAIYIMQILSSGLSLLLTSILFTFIFKFIPSTTIKWASAAIGAIFTTLLFVPGQYLLVMALNQFADFSAFGAASTVITLLIWVFYSSTVFFIGAEFIKALQETRKK